MTHPDVTDAQVIDTIKAVAAEKLEYVYSTPQHMDRRVECYYVHTGKEDESKLSPGCLIGVVLNRLGVPLETLREYEGESAYRLLGELFPKLSKDTRIFADTAQSKQDTRDSWGDAVAAANEL